MDCAVCKTGEMGDGIAMQNTVTGTGDFHDGDTVCAVSVGGTGRLISCLKCRVCGHSISKGSETKPETDFNGL